MARETKTKPVTFIDYNFVAYPEGTITFDKELNIDWGIKRNKLIVSEKDKNQKPFDW